MQPAKRIATMRTARQDELLLWYAKQPRAIRVLVHAEKLKIFRGWLSEPQTDGDQAYTKEELDYLSLLGAVAEMKRSIDEPKKEKDFERRVKQLASQRRNTSAPVTSKIEKEFLPLIHQLRSTPPRPMSWRKVREYIKKHHYKTFGVSTMIKAYQAEYGEDAL
jgi:hypothetical protein